MFWVRSAKSSARKGIMVGGQLPDQDGKHLGRKECPDYPFSVRMVSGHSAYDV